MIIPQEESSFVQKVREAAHTNATDAIVEAFEEKLKQSIIGKTLVASQDKQPLKLTDEEMAYLTKQAVENSAPQMKVEIPSPTITLKKGKTELNIKNAAALLQKMEEKYPTPKWTPPLNPTVPPFPGQLINESEECVPPFPGRPTDESDEGVTAQKIDEIIDELEAEINANADVPNETKKSTSPVEEKESDASMANEFKKRVNFPTHKVNPLIAKCVAPDIEAFQSNPPEIVKTVNRNAYEIREGVLGMALDFIKWQTDIIMVMTRESGEKSDMANYPTSDIVLDVAKKFYSFVENRR